VSKKRLITILLIGTATLAVLYLSYFLFGRQAIAKPLQTELSQLDSVKKVNIVKAKQGQPTVVEITPHPTRDLAFLYHQVDAIVKRKLPTYEIEILAVPNRQAELLFNQLSLHFYGGLERGDYEAMAQRMSALAAQQGWEIIMQMDETNVYIVMQRSAEVWYRVIKRYPSPLKEEKIS